MVGDGGHLVGICNYDAGKDPEQVLHDACEKFIRRFGAMESAARQAGRSLDSLSRGELLSLWSQQKTAEQKDSAKT